MLTTNSLNHAGQLFMAENIQLLKSKITELLTQKKNGKIEKQDIDNLFSGLQTEKQALLQKYDVDN